MSPVQRTRVHMQRTGWLVAGLLLCLVPGAAGSVLSNWQLQPRFDSQFLVSKTQSTWTNTLKLSRDIDRVDLKGSLETRDKEDERRNDYVEAMRKMLLRGGSQHGPANIFLEGKFSRHGTVTTRSQRQIDVDDIDIGSTIDVLARDLTWLGLELRGGRVSRSENNDRFSSLKSVYDLTRTTGLNGGAGIETGWEPRETFSLSASGSYDVVVEDSRTQHIETDADTTTVDEVSDENHSYDTFYDVNCEWTRYDAAKVAFTASQSLVSAQYYQASQTTQETKGTVQSITRLTVEGDLPYRFRYGVDVRSTVSCIDFLVQTRDRYDSTTDLKMRGRHELGLPVLEGAVVRAELGLGRSRQENEGTTGFDTRRRKLSGDLSQPLGNRASVTVRGSESLTQDFYEDGLDDQDRLRTEATVSGKYDPSPAFGSEASFTANTEEIIKIHSSAASQSQRKRDYKVSAKYHATLPWGIVANQSFLLSATYTYYIYDEERSNTLSRSNRVTTTLTIPLWERTHMRLDHSFRTNDSGTYDFSETAGISTYAKSREKLQHILNVALRYQVTSILFIGAENYYDVSHTTRLDTETTTTTTKLEFTGEAGLEKRLLGNVDFRAVVARTASSVENDYWNIRASVGKIFS